MIRINSCNRCSRCCSADELYKFPLLMGDNIINSKEYCKFLYFTDGKGVCKVFIRIQEIMGLPEDTDFKDWDKTNIPSSVSRIMVRELFITQHQWSWIKNNCIGYPDASDENYCPPNYSLFPECSFSIIAG